MDCTLPDSHLRDAEKLLSLHVLRRDDRLQLLFTHFCGTQISLVEDRPGERRPGEINSLQIRPAQISANEIGFSQPGMREQSMRQVCPEGGITTSSYLNLNGGSVTTCAFHHHARLAEISATKIGST